MKETRLVDWMTAIGLVVMAVCSVVGQVRAEEMPDLGRMQRLIATIGLECPGAVVEMKRPAEMCVPARDGGPCVQLAGGFHNPDKVGGSVIIWINREMTAKQQWATLVHEGVHCGRYFERKWFGIRQPPDLDDREPPKGEDE